MKKITGLLSLAIVSGSLMAGLPAKADTAYHAVYNQPVLARDTFSILDIFENNVLTPQEYNNGVNVAEFRSVDTNKDGFIGRTEFYSVNQTEAGLASIMPAAGGEGTRGGAPYNDLVYRDDPCEFRGTNTPSCRETVWLPQKDSYHE